jgi:3-deoxy-D-manno-octulosonic-acid transferase
MSKRYIFVYFLYSILLFLFLLFSTPYFLFRMLTSGKYKKGLKQRLGFIPEARKKDIIWVHAVSVGEIIAAAPVIDTIRRTYPAYNFLISTVTDTGQDMARKIISDPKEIVYFPLDFSWIVKRTLEIIRPKLFIMVETELWPNFIRQTKRRGIPSVVVNGRISPSSYKGYRIIKPFLKMVLSNINLFCMQSDMDRGRIVSLGAPEKSTYVTGNVKFDGLKTDIPEEDKLTRQLKDALGDLILVAGSTHPKEEEIILDVYKEAKEEFTDLVLILAPRHPERTKELEVLCRHKGFSFIRRTRLTLPSQPPRSFQSKPRISVVLLDTIGELGQVYSLATVVFVGGSLVPIGGHNILEPAALGKVPLFGPYMHNFVESARLLIAGGGGIQVENSEELLERVLSLLREKEERVSWGKKAQRIVSEHQGASGKTVELIGSLLG